MYFIHSYSRKHSCQVSCVEFTPDRTVVPNSFCNTAMWDSVFNDPSTGSGLRTPDVGDTQRIHSTFISHPQGKWTTINTKDGNAQNIKRHFIMCNMKRVTAASRCDCHSCQEEAGAAGAERFWTILMRQLLPLCLQKTQEVHFRVRGVECNCYICGKDP